jgi:Fe-Mn family superoxide dismutase
MKYFSTFLTEEKAKLALMDLPYKKGDLEPVMSRETINYHYGKLAKGYVERYNKGEGDPKFNKAGAFLHNIFFPQLRPPVQSNKPSGELADMINSKFGSFDDFKNKVEEIAMKIQGSGWVYVTNTGEIKTIVNHEVRDDIMLLIDWWEHAWALDYQADKKKYLKNIWRIINWDVVNKRFQTIK